jgi:uncharacterized membrane protein
LSDAYQLWKTAHILSAAILFGAGFGIAFFCWFGYRGAMRSGDIGALRAVLRLTVVADACLTAPAVVFQALSGLVLMHILGWPLASTWSIAVWCLYVLVGLCWLPVVAIQIKLKREAEGAASIAALSDRFHFWFRWWFALGVPAFTAVVLIFYLMVAKPLSLIGI